ncbi:hypothetical protein [Burkholderia ubonensis]|uniref:hypothetical protein n=1 Tax=Burkholderia ubonensis TaxID=101571 RepID=UPI0012FC382A|nr:hypothetical protein [Burkholderia ubonensis]
MHAHPADAAPHVRGKPRRPAVHRYRFRCISHETKFARFSVFDAAARGPSTHAQGSPITGTLFASPRGAASTAQAVTISETGVGYGAGVETCGGQPNPGIALPMGGALSIPDPAS